ERLEIERRPRGLVSRKLPKSERRTKKPHSLLRAAELVREIPSPQEAECVQLRIGAQLSATLQRRERNVEAATEPCPICRLIERQGDFLVRPSYRRRLVPDSPVLIACKRPCERSVRPTALLARCRPINSRPDQRVPEPELALVKRAESGCDGRRPAVAVGLAAVGLGGRVARLGDVASIKRREQQRRWSGGVESGEPRRKRRLQPGCQRQRFRRPDQIEIGRCRRELDQGKRIASRLYENPLLQLAGQGGPVRFEKRARRGVVQPGKDELREAG